MAEPAVLALQRLADPARWGPCWPGSGWCASATSRMPCSRDRRGAGSPWRPRPITRAWGEKLRLDPAGAVASYLRLVLTAPRPATTSTPRNGSARRPRLARADIAPLVPVLLARLGGPDAPHWAEAVFRPRPEARGRAWASTSPTPTPAGAARCSWWRWCPSRRSGGPAAAARGSGGGGAGRGVPALALTGSPEASARLIPLLRTGSPAERAAAVDGLVRGPKEPPSRPGRLPRARHGRGRR